MRHKRLKNSSIETDNIIQSTKIDETQQSNLFLKLLDYFVQPPPHTIRIFVYYVKNLEEDYTKLL